MWFALKIVFDDFCVELKINLILLKLTKHKKNTELQKTTKNSQTAKQTTYLPSRMLSESEKEQLRRESKESEMRGRELIEEEKKKEAKEK